MKKPMAFFAVLILLFSLSFQAMAFSFDLDGSYYLGLGEKGIDKKSGGFGVFARAGIIGDIWTDGTFLSTKTEHLMSGGALYQIVNERDLSVLIGGGYLELNTKVTNDSDLKGRGIYWKMALKYMAAPDLIIGGEVSYVPFYHFGDNKNSFLLGRATLSYELYRDLGLQVSVQNYKTADKNSSKDPLVGLGIAFRH